jgi:hypothetical protein
MISRTILNMTYLQTFSVYMESFFYNQNTVKIVTQEQQQVIEDERHKIYYVKKRARLLTIDHIHLR